MTWDRQRLQDIAQAAAAIARSIAGLDSRRFAALFASDATFADALSYRLVVIAEAVNALLGDPAQGRVSAAVIAAQPQIDWPGYAATRHILAHQYFRRDPALIWTTISDELPALHDVVTRELARRA
ncbi:MAG TPA: HepT-like ribonuclease domain-containing protein [Candidatus Angelobacter sp.]|nr:HepT-like ribonuclease domain-containing protein [Candidatus Angelobacter sp.]